MFSRVFVVFTLLLTTAGWAGAGEAPISTDTQDCLGCHEVSTPGIVADWETSGHARTSPGRAMEVEGLSRKISAQSVPAGLTETVVGCAECHARGSEAHGDRFEHNGYDIHVVVTPEDCAACHPKEREQYGENIMSRAVGNLADNPLFQDLAASINNTPVVSDQGLSLAPAGEAAEAESCYHCHGTRLSVEGTEVRETPLGEMKFPVIAGWPNQGVGRVNPDGSAGSCTSCHPRHGFSMAVARKPFTCTECHQGPDVPAGKVYQLSKHGNLFNSLRIGWNWTAVPWSPGEDFTAPTCAACHMSLLADAEGNALVPRTHKVSDRLPWRIFGLPYAHPQPKSPDTTIIRNSAGQPLPTDFSGGFATDFLIGEKEMAQREETMRSVCGACHDTSWTAGHWARLEATIKDTNARVLAATKLMERGWKKGLAKGPAQGGSPFDEAMEKIWQEAWLFSANEVRFASAMAGGGDYGVFAGGRFDLNREIAELWRLLGEKGE
ncbi:MAG: hydroxylamine oxidase [Proteobacteria bacterium]|nr:hydroxylamine oxidase [Pseudomonadota bacterium]